MANLDEGQADEHTTISEIFFPPSPAWVVEVADGGACRRCRLTEGQELTFGASSQAGFQIHDATVSGIHGRARVHNGWLEVIDHPSRNGIYVAGARVDKATFDQGGCFVAGRTVLVVAPVREEDDEEDASDEPPIEGMVGPSMPMRRLARVVRRFAAMKASVLIRGETGTGKELVAQALHKLGANPRGPFVPLNMGALAAELVDSELFGHEKGAFTGAVATKPGAFEVADKGTLFLDEVAELPAPAQAKLLRALESGEVRPVGGARAKRVNVRVVAASWALLQDRVAQGKFREDLFHRLAVLTIRVPPLRERQGDVAYLARSFLVDMAPDVGEKVLTPGALSRLSTYRWPGNVRELKNVLWRAAVVPGRAITSVHVERALVPFAAPSAQDAQEKLQDARKALDQHGGNKSSAARSMGVPRSTFRGWVSGKTPKK